MTEQKFEGYLRKVNQLSTDERRMLSDRLSHVDHQNEVFDLIESHFNEQGCCPHCASVAYYRHGFANDLQRYRCCDCGRTFNALTATPLARLRKREHWLSFLTTLIESRSVRTQGGCDAGGQREDGLPLASPVSSLNQPGLGRVSTWYHRGR